MKRGWQIAIRKLNRGEVHRLIIPRFILTLALIVSAGGGWILFSALHHLKSVEQLVQENKHLTEMVKIKDNQLQFFANRMSEIRDELHGIQKLNQFVEMKLGKIEEIQEGGLGGPMSRSPGRDAKRIVYLNSESEILDQLWTEVDELEEETRLEKAKSRALMRFFRSQSALLSAIPSLRPIEGGFISSPYGKRHDPFTGKYKMHTGIDLAHSNHVPVHATAEGIVVFAGWSDSYGNLVIIYHGFGLSTRYAHLHRIDISKGDWVKKGQTIGLLGKTGRAKGTHLHYEVRLEGRPINPYYFLPPQKKG